MKKRDLQSVIDSSMAAIAKLREPGGETKANQFAFLMEMAKVAGLDNDDPDVKRLKRIWGKQLNERREAYGLTQRAVARKVYVSHKTVAAMERGESHISRYPLVMFMFEAYICELETEKEKLAQPA